MLDDIYQTFVDPEGNFLEQFQTSGFDSRYFELYLFAYFLRSAFVIDRTRPNPDFLVSRDGMTVAVEATTVNPSTSGALAKLGKPIAELSPEEVREYQRHELPIRFGSPLFSKLQKEYWKLEHCRDLPFVIAIQAFHDEESLALSDHALTTYLYGQDHVASWDSTGRLEIQLTELGEHRAGSKSIPSNFFKQSLAEHVSAVMFSNSGTNAKFARMGYQHGIGNDTIDIRRIGYCLNLDPDAMDPTLFGYDLDDPPLVESWGQGLVVLHNPTCRRPLPKSFFREAVQGSLEDGRVKLEVLGWHPFSSKSLILYLGDAKKELAQAFPVKRLRFAIGAITKDEFQAICGFALPPSNPIGEEHGWFSDETNAFLGVVVRDKIDDDWGYVILARDRHFQFRAIEVAASISSRDRARTELQRKAADLLSRPQRIFPQQP